MFQTRRFKKLAHRAGIPERLLCLAATEVLLGQGADLGGGVWKKRCADNRERAILLARGGRRAVFVHLFAKQDQSDLNPRELQAFRHLAAAYAGLTDDQCRSLIANGDLEEICHARPSPPCL